MNRSKLVLVFALFFYVAPAMAQQKKHKVTDSLKQHDAYRPAKRKATDSVKKTNGSVPVKKNKTYIVRKSEVIRLEKHRKDTSYKTRPLLDVKTKEITKEFICSPNATVFLRNIMRKVNIVTTNDAKIRLTTTVHYQGNPSFTDDEWLTKMEVSIGGNESNVEIKTNNLTRQGKQVIMYGRNNERRPDTIFNSISVYDSLGNWINRKSSFNRNIVLYIPAGVKLDIESKYADVIIENNIGELKTTITNGSLSLKDANSVTATGVYGHFYTGNIQYANVDITNGKLIGKHINTLDLVSKNCTVELERIESLGINSQADRFDLEEVKNIKGKKDYGLLRLTSLTGSLDISGVNSDVKIRRIENAASLLKITTQYAELRLPIGELKNYSVDFEGTNTNVYAGFEKNASSSSFKTTVGSKTERSTVFQLHCNNCTIDFK